MDLTELSAKQSRWLYFTHVLKVCGEAVNARNTSIKLGHLDEGCILCAVRVFMSVTLINKSKRLLMVKSGLQIKMCRGGSSGRRAYKFLLLLSLWRTAGEKGYGGRGWE